MNAKEKAAATMAVLQENLRLSIARTALREEYGQEPPELIIRPGDRSLSSYAIDDPAAHVAVQALTPAMEAEAEAKYAALMKRAFNIKE